MVISHSYVTVYQLVYFMENPMNMDDLGVPYDSGNLHIKVASSIAGKPLLLTDGQAVETLDIAGIHLHHPLSVAQGLLVPSGGM